MSVAALRPPPERSRVGLRLVVALAAVLTVGAIAALAAWLLAPAAAPPPPRNPFGTGLRESAPAASGLGSWLLAWQGRFYAGLREHLSALRESGSALPALLGVGFAYGVFHAAGPGHGKAVISAYLVASERALPRGLALSAAAALIQALVAIALVTAVFGIVGGTAAVMGRVANGVELAGFALVAALGAALVWRKAGKVVAVVQPARTAAADCGHLHGPGPADASWRELAAVALGAGIRPCAGAIVLLTLARAQGLYAAGIAATVAMAVGTALTTGALATLAVYAKRLALRLAGGRGRTGEIAMASAELAAGAAVLVIGLALLFGAGAGGPA